MNKKELEENKKKALDALKLIMYEIKHDKIDVTEIIALRYPILIDVSYAASTYQETIESDTYQIKFDAKIEYKKEAK